MLSDEEKKAIEYIKNCLDNEYDFKNATRQKDKKAYNIILNLIEKQSKEIEGLKEDNKKKSIVIIEYQDLYEKLVDKIKSKIEELKEDIKYSANPLSIGNSKFGIKVLQSLLEKE